MIDRDRLVATFVELAKIDSPSSEEEEIARHLARTLEHLGLSVARDAYGNVIGTDGEEDGESEYVLLSAHMDTVEPGRGIEPIVEGDRIRTNETTILGGDCKAGVAAVLEAIRSIKEDDVPHVPYQVAFTREEEIGLVGARNLDFSMIGAKWAVVFDGEGPPSQITSSSPTYMGFEFEITGRAAHAGVEPEKGLSAIRLAAELITRLPQGRLDDETTFNVGTIEGGTVRNAVPENATVTGEFRSRNLEALDAIQVQLDDALRQVRDLHPDAKIDMHVHTEFETYTLTEDDPATVHVMGVLRGLGLEPSLRPSGGGTDGNVFRQHGISSVVVGMADHGMHTVREYVTIPDLVDAAHLCESVLRE